MKWISKDAARTVNALVKEARQNGNAITISNNDTYMGAVIEDLNELYTINKTQYKMVSIAHYTKANGDLIPDPEIVFLIHPDDETFITPLHFRDSLGTNHSLYQKNEGKYFMSPLLSQICSFCSTWLKNIKQQQNITIEKDPEGGVRIWKPKK